MGGGEAGGLRGQSLRLARAGALELFSVLPYLAVLVREELTPSASCKLLLYSLGVRPTRLGRVDQLELVLFGKQRSFDLALF